jgi:hypothetical protein
VVVEKLKGRECQVYCGVEGEVQDRNGSWRDTGVSVPDRILEGHRGISTGPDPGGTQGYQYRTGSWRNTGVSVPDRILEEHRGISTGPDPGGTQGTIGDEVTIECCLLCSFQNVVAYGEHTHPVLQLG